MERVEVIYSGYPRNGIGDVIEDEDQFMLVLFQLHQNELNLIILIIMTKLKLKYGWKIQ